MAICPTPVTEGTVYLINRAGLNNIERRWFWCALSQALFGDRRAETVHNLVHRRLQKVGHELVIALRVYVTNGVGEG